MDDFEVIKDPKLDEYLQASLEAGYAFDDMTRQKGWDYVKAIIDGTIKNFTNKALIKGFSTMEEFNFERGIVEGQRRILSEIDSTLKVLRKHQEDERAGAGTTPTEP
jgi:hypothetical protein